MTNWVYDSSQEDLLTVFKSYEVEELKFLWRQTGPASSRQVFEAVNEAMGGRSISRASVINSLNRMVELGVLEMTTTTGKGGYRGLYAASMKEDELKRFIYEKLTQSLKSSFC